MAQFDVYRLRDTDTLVLDVQSDLIAALSTRVVVPLVPVENAPTQVQGLTPTLGLKGTRYRAMVPAMAAVPGSELGRAVDSAVADQDIIRAALDRLLIGF